MVSLLPNAKQQFADQFDVPLAGGLVYFYIPGTNTLKSTWQDPALTIPNSNPVQLDAGGYAVIWGSGSYRQVVTDSNGVTIWDQVTSAYDGASSPVTPNVPAVSITFGNFNMKPSPALGSAYFAKDLGSHGVLLMSDGVVWKPATGSAVITQSGSAIAKVGPVSESNVISIPIPAGLLSANGVLALTATWGYPLNTNGKNALVRFDSAAGITGTIFQNLTFGLTSSSRFRVEISNANSTGAQIGVGSGITGYGTTAATAATASVDTTQISYINIDLTLAGSDTVNLLSYRVEWFEP